MWMETSLGGRAEQTTYPYLFISNGDRSNRVLPNEFHATGLARRIENTMAHLLRPTSRRVVESVPLSSAGAHAPYTRL